jgi:hypothetical protein
MNESIFWHIIGKLNWSAEADNEILAPAIEELSSYTTDEIYLFSDILSEKLYLLDTQKHAENIGRSSFKKGKYFSPDVFLYSRACVVANGRNYFEQILKKPELMPKNIDFEALIYLPQKAYAKKTGTYLFEHTPSKSYETYSNTAGWEHNYESLYLELLTA